MAFKQGKGLLFGVDTYQHAPQLNVPVASADAAAVAGILVDPRYCGYPTDQVQSISQSAATRDNILNALDQLARQVKPEDTVFLFHCGHGDYGADGDYYLICHDSRVEGNRVASGTGISQRELLEKIKAIPAERLLLVFNACHSGEISPSLGADQALGGKNLPEMLSDALLSAGSGRSVITACREAQKSWIGKGEISIFTQALVDGLRGQGISPRKGFISLFDLYTALFERVSHTVEELLGQQQEPELTILKGVGPFAVALYQGATSTSLSVVETGAKTPEAPAVRQIEPERSSRLFQQLVTQTGGISFGLGNQVDIQGDVIGGDQIDVRGFIQNPAGPVAQHFGNQVNTGGGAYTGGDVKMQGGNFAGRDLDIQYGGVRAGRDIITENVAGRDIIQNGGQISPEIVELNQLMRELLAQLARSGLDAETKAVVKEDLKTVEKEAHKPQPNKATVRSRLSGIQGMLQEATAKGMAVAGLIEVFQRIQGLMGQLLR